ncbi:hypothetical protein F2Q69_00063540 [Brassica cretica]|uniref:F-box associated beta-propeller type 1 domain-containing protein n=1 Tax=Brassica cretica TaxID=69181 RepID=A0A8S9RJ48_BRACR|nr:hypothetical protein F2Q69_00063540 [Brassica cretica]
MRVRVTNGFAGLGLTLRFRSVSKKWRSTIDSPRFQSRELKLRRQSRGHDLLFVAYYEDPPDDLAQHALGSCSSCIYRTVKFPFPNLLLCYGSCDGLVCLFCIHTPNVVVNPATRWHRSFPFSSLQRLIIDKGRPPFASDLTYELGFGKDKLSATYKPVWLYNSSEYGLDNVTTCEVFDFSTHSWRNLVPSLFDRYGLVPLPVAILEKNKLYLHGRGYLEPLMLHDLHSQSYELIGDYSPFQCLPWPLASNDLCSLLPNCVASLRHLIQVQGGFPASVEAEVMSFTRRQVFFVLSVLVLTMPFSAGVTNLRDVSAINNLYITLGAPSLPRWLAFGGDPCGEKWQGVVCDSSNITEIFSQVLTSVIIVGGCRRIPGMKGQLPQALPSTIRNLSLSSNRFTGNIPFTLSFLSDLSELSLGNNLLSGEIPDYFQQLSKLTKLYAFSSSVLSSQVFHLTCLECSKQLILRTYTAKSIKSSPFQVSLNTSSSATVFAVASLQQYTNSFSEEHIIGEGSLGNVYKAVFPHGKFLAVRKLSNTINRTQSDGGDFLHLVSNVLKLKRGNILEFLGYYALHLDRKLNKKLTWNVRMNIALGAAKALQTVKFWDLETFELIGSTRLEATGVRSIAFHPDGQTLFCGLDDGLKVYSWEPVICRDSVDMGWSTLGDMCINENKFVGCSYYRNSVGIWVSDISKLEPYGAGSEDENECMVKRFSALDEQASERMKSGSRGSSSPDYETKEIKNIYVDSIGGNLKAAIRASEKQNADDKSSRMHSVVDSDSGEESSHSRSESVASSKTSPGMMLRPAHVRKTLAKFEESASVQSGTRKKSAQDVEEETQTRNAEDSTIKGIMYKFEKALSSEPPTDEATRMLHKPPRVKRSSYDKNHNESRRAMSVDSATLNDSKGGLEYSVKVVSGRTRSLVERFERGEKITHTKAENTNAVEQDPHKTLRQTGEIPVVVSTQRARSTPALVMPVVLNRDSNMKSDESPSTQPARTSSVPVILNQATNDEPSVTLTQSRTSPSQEAKVVRGFTRHISNCSALEFHPFGQYLAC